MGWNARDLTPVGRSPDCSRYWAWGFRPGAAGSPWVSLQNTVEAHHLGTAVGTLSFLRNLCATIIVAVFGALVLVGSARVLPRGVDGPGFCPPNGSRNVFYVAAASLVVSLIALLLMEERPLRSNRPAPKGSTGGDAPRLSLCNAPARFRNAQGREFAGGIGYLRLFGHV